MADAREREMGEAHAFVTPFGDPQWCRECGLSRDHPIHWRRDLLRELVGAIERWRSPMRDDHTLCKAADAALPVLRAYLAAVPAPAEPTRLSAQINALPEPLRRFVMELETQCDPAGTIREVVMLRDRCAQLEAAIAAPAAEPVAQRPLAVDAMHPTCFQQGCRMYDAAATKRERFWKETAHKWAEQGERITATWTNACHEAERELAASRERERANEANARRYEFMRACRTDDWERLAHYMGDALDEQIDAALAAPDSAAEQAAKESK